MNLFHRWYCRSDTWKRHLESAVLPGALDGVELGDNVLELGPGPGLTTDWLRSRVPHLTAVEIDRRLAATLGERLAGANVAVVEGDATAMTFADGSFSSALCFTMLHHVPSAALQDRVFVEVHRVLRPGGAFIGRDSTLSLRWRLYHLFDTCTPVDPDTLPGRLAQAGFQDVEVGRTAAGFAFKAHKPR